jgi:hypothetical protein
VKPAKDKFNTKICKYNYFHLAKLEFAILL